MRYLFMIHGDTEAEAAMTPEERRAIVEEHFAYGAMLRERGVYVLGEALTGEAFQVVPGDAPLVTDGPFADTKGESAGSTSSTARAAWRRSTSPAVSRAAPAWQSRCSRSRISERRTQPSQTCSS
jgi:hypothetical protein